MKNLIFANNNVIVFKESEYLEIKYLNPQIIKIKADDRIAIDDEVIRMIIIRDENNRKYFNQEEIGKIIGVSRQMINRRWQVYKKEGLIALLKREWENSKITEKLVERITEICVENPFLSIEEIIKILQSEGIVKNISKTTVYNAQRKMNGRKLLELLRRKSNKSNPKSFIEASYMIEKLFEIINELFTKVPKESINELEHKISLYKTLKSLYRKLNSSKRGPNKKDRYQPRKKLNRDRIRNIGFIKWLLTGKSLLNKCPECHSSEIKYLFKRRRFYINYKGKKILDYSYVYKCLNSACNTKCFTRPPKGVELYARVHKKVKQMTLRWLFHLRGSYSRVCDELAENGIIVHLTTVLRWTKKAGEECVDTLKIVNQEDKEQALCIDEKWIKVRNNWCYVFISAGAMFTDLLALDLFYHKNKDAMRTFLLYLKLLGFRPKSITTDLLMGYENTVKEIFPDTYYHQCVLHAERDAKKIVRMGLRSFDGNIDENNEEWKKILTKKIRTLFSSKKTKQVKKRFAKIMILKAQAPESVLGVFSMLEKYYPKLYQSVIRKDLPKTTNAVERVIGEFEEKYQITKGFNSFYYAQFFLKVFQVYYRLRKISFGRFKSKNRLELKGNPIGKLKFTDYLTPTQT